MVVTAIKNMNFGQIADLTTLMEAVNSVRVKLNADPRFFLRKPLIYSTASTLLVQDSETKLSLWTS